MSKKVYDVYLVERPPENDGCGTEILVWIIGGAIVVGVLSFIFKVLLVVLFIALSVVLAIIGVFSIVVHIFTLWLFFKNLFFTIRDIVKHNQNYSNPSSSLGANIAKRILGVLLDFFVFYGVNNGLAIKDEFQKMTDSFSGFISRAFHFFTMCSLAIIACASPVIFIISCFAGTPVSYFDAFDIVLRVFVEQILRPLDLCSCEGNSKLEQILLSDCSDWACFN